MQTAILVEAAAEHYKKRLGWFETDIAKGTAGLLHHNSRVQRLWQPWLLSIGKCYDSKVIDIE